LQARLPGYTLAQASAVLDALTMVSDHLPVVAQYQLPAMMNVKVAATPERVILGGSATLAVTVSNTAPVLVANGADELDYTVSGGGAASGVFTDVDLALGGGNTHLLTLASDGVGLRSGSVAVHSPSQAAAHADFSSTISYMVVDHAKPLFAGSADPISLTLDFGVVPQFADGGVRTFSIANWMSGLGDAAGLDLDEILAAGGVAPFSTDLAPFSDLGAGDAFDFHMGMATDVAGIFGGTYTLSFSDEDLPGAASAGTLTLHVSGQVAAVPEPGTVSLLLVAFGFCGLWLRYRNGHRA
jgi:hypothetical protein